MKSIKAEGNECFHYKVTHRPGKIILPSNDKENVPNSSFSNRILTLASQNQITSNSKRSCTAVCYSDFFLVKIVTNSR